MLRDPSLIPLSHQHQHGSALTVLIDRGLKAQPNQPFFLLIPRHLARLTPANSSSRPYSGTGGRSSRLPQQHGPHVRLYRRLNVRYIPFSEGTPNSAPPGSRCCTRSCGRSRIPSAVVEGRPLKFSPMGCWRAPLSQDQNPPDFPQPCTSLRLRAAGAPSP